MATSSSHTTSTLERSWPPAEPGSELSEEEREEMMKQLEEIYGPGYVETYMKDKENDKR